jgi:hypothetical protein
MERQFMWIVALGMMILTLGGCANQESGGNFWTDIPATTSPPSEAPTVVPTSVEEDRPSDEETQSAPDVSEDFVMGLMQIEGVDVRVLSPAPAEVEASVRGVLGDACTEFDSVEQLREGQTVTLTLRTKRPADMICAQMARAYERVVPLEGNFAAGEYRLVANGFEAAFSVAEVGEETPVGGLAFVDDVQVMLMESYPVQVALVVSGWLPDGCTQLDAVRQAREGNTIRVTMTTRRPAEAFCTQAIVPFTERVGLEGGFESGVYRAVVNDFEVGFEVD